MRHMAKHHTKRWGGGCACAPAPIIRHLDRYRSRALYTRSETKALAT